MTKAANGILTVNFHLNDASFTLTTVRFTETNIVST